MTSMLHQVNTTAVLHKGSWVLNGTERLIANGKGATIAIVIAVTDSTLGRQGLSAFIVSCGTPGFIAGKPEHDSSIRTPFGCDIRFENCQIAENCLLGHRGDGFSIAISDLEARRISVAAQAVGIARSAYEVARALSKRCERVSGLNPECRDRLDEMHTAINAARLLTHHAAQLRTARQPCISEASQAKLLASEMAEEVCAKAIKIQRALGVRDDDNMKRHYRDAQSTSINEGTSEIQRLIIARELLAPKHH
jgi:alkylation response protein AidB-like acyl-CoA dehydrogenase